MGRLALAAFVAAVLAYAAGCADRGLGDGGDGGSGDCTSLNESACLADSQCQAHYCSFCSCTPSFVGCLSKDAHYEPCAEPPCPFFTCDCHGLDEQSCIATETNSGCKPSYCGDCNGGQAFAGCLNSNEPGPECPALCAMKTCHDNSDCPNAEACVPPVTSNNCPLCAPCNSDNDCFGGLICETTTCCGGSTVCTPKCTLDSQCEDGWHCSFDGHCVQTTCNASGGCDPFFDCSSAGTCERRACSDDSACESGVCVDGACYGTLGTCGAGPMN